MRSHWFVDAIRRGVVFSPAAFVMLAAQPTLADPHPKGFREFSLNGPVAPVTEDGVTTFKIVDRGCSDVDYGDGRGESDCVNGNLKSTLIAARDASVGKSYEYHFELRVDPAIDFPAVVDGEAMRFLEGGLDSQLRIASWEGSEINKSFVYMLKLDSTRGITFLGAVCQPPSEFGEWVAFSLKVKWAEDDRGWVEARCDDDVVYFDESVATTVSPQCYTTNECIPGVIPHPTKMNFIVGPAVNGWGHTWKQQGKPSPFRTVQPEGITVQMRNLGMREGAELYGPVDRALVEELQRALNGLGCDVGAADGVAGRKTKEAAVSCRMFPDGAMPAELDRETLPVFVSLYTSEEVVNLSPGVLVAAADPLTGLMERELEISILGLGSQTTGRDPEAIADFHGPTGKLIPGHDKTDFIFAGPYDFESGTFTSFQIILEKDAGPSASADCGGVVVDRSDGGRVVLNFTRTEDGFAVAGLDCAARTLPEAAAREAELIVDHFDDIAVGMVIEGTVDGARHEGLQDFIRKVARGEIRVGRAE